MVAKFKSIASALALTVSSLNERDVPYNSNGELSYNEKHVCVSYDCGNSSPFINAEIYAMSRSETSGHAPYLYVELNYADRGNSKWTNIYDDNMAKYDKVKSVELTYNPWNVDYLEITSFARASYGSIIDYKLNVVDKTN